MRSFIIIISRLAVGCSPNSQTPEQYLINQKSVLLKEVHVEYPKRSGYNDERFWFYDGPFQIADTSIYKIFVVRESDQHVFSAIVDKDVKFNVGDEVKLVMISHRNHVGVTNHIFGIQN